MGRFSPSEALAFEAARNAWAPLIQNPSQIVVPAEFGELKDARAGLPGAPLLIHIQDAHANLSGQESTAKFLDSIFSRYGTVPVLVEGGTRDDSLTSLRAMASTDVWKKVARKFLLEGKIAGEEYLNLTSGHPMRILGVEDAALYRGGLEAYADLAENREEALARVKRLRAAASMVKRTVYPKELRRLDDACGEDHRGVECARLLSGSEAYPSLALLGRALEKEKSVDFDAARLEQAAVAEKLIQRVKKPRHSERAQAREESPTRGDPSAASPPQDDAWLKSLRPFGARNDTGGFLGRIAHFSAFVELAQKSRIRIEDYPALSSYRAYVDSLRAIRPDALLEEMERAFEARFEAAGDAVRTLRAVDRHLALLENAHEIRMSSEEFARLSESAGDFTETAVEAYLNRRLAERGSFRDLLPASERLTKSAPLVEAFYRSAAERDEAFVRNAEKWMKAEKADVAVLIAGGYHTDALIKKFSEKGWSYAVITPRITSETIQEKYERVLLESLHKKPMSSRASEQRERVEGSNPESSTRPPKSAADSLGMTSQSGIVAPKLAEAAAGARMAELMDVVRAYSGARRAPAARLSASPSLYPPASQKSTAEKNAEIGSGGFFEGARLTARFVNDWIRYGYLSWVYLLVTSSGIQGVLSRLGIEDRAVLVTASLSLSLLGGIVLTGVILTARDVWVGRKPSAARLAVKEGSKDLQKEVVRLAAQRGLWGHGVGRRTEFRMAVSPKKADQPNAFLNIIVTGRINRPAIGPFRLTPVIILGLNIFFAGALLVEAVWNLDVSALGRAVIAVVGGYFILTLQPPFYALFKNQFLPGTYSTDFYGPYWVVLRPDEVGDSRKGIFDFRSLLTYHRTLPHYWRGLPENQHLAYLFPDEDLPFLRDGILDAFGNGKMTAAAAEKALVRLATFSEFVRADGDLRKVISRYSGARLADREGDKEGGREKNYALTLVSRWSTRVSNLATRLFKSGTATLRASSTPVNRSSTPESLSSTLSSLPGSGSTTSTTDRNSPLSSSIMAATWAAVKSLFGPLGSIIISPRLGRPTLSAVMNPVNVFLLPSTFHLQSSISAGARMAANKSELLRDRKANFRLVSVFSVVAMTIAVYFEKYSISTWVYFGGMGSLVVSVELAKRYGRLGRRAEFGELIEELASSPGKIPHDLVERFSNIAEFGDLELIFRRLIARKADSSPESLAGYAVFARILLKGAKDLRYRQWVQARFDEVQHKLLNEQTNSLAEWIFPEHHLSFSEALKAIAADWIPPLRERFRWDELARLLADADDDLFKDFPRPYADPSLVKAARGIIRLEIAAKRFAKDRSAQTLGPLKDRISGLDRVLTSFNNIPLHRFINDKALELLRANPGLFLDENGAPLQLRQFIAPYEFQKTPPDSFSGARLGTTAGLQSEKSVESGDLARRMEDLPWAIAVQNVAMGLGRDDFSAVSRELESARSSGYLLGEEWLSELPRTSSGNWYEHSRGKVSRLVEKSFGGSSLDASIDWVSPVAMMVENVFQHAVAKGRRGLVLIFAEPERRAAWIYVLDGGDGMDVRAVLKRRHSDAKYGGKHKALAQLMKGGVAGDEPGSFIPYSPWAVRSGRVLYSGFSKTFEDRVMFHPGVLFVTRVPIAGARLASSTTARASEPAPNRLDGVTLISYSADLDAAGGVRNYLLDLNKALLQRNRMTIYQLYLPKTADAPKIEEQIIGQGKLVLVPAPISLNEPLSFVESRRGPNQVLAFVIRRILFKVLPRAFLDRVRQFLLSPNMIGFASHLPLIGAPARRVFAVRDFFDDFLKQHRFAENGKVLFINHSPSAPSAFWLAQSARNGGISALHEYHASLNRHESALRKLSEISRGSAVDSGFMRSDLRRQYVDLSSGVDTEKFDPSRADRNYLKKKLGLENNPVLLVSARIEPNKGQMHALKAAHLLKERYKDRFYLVFAGPEQNPEYARALRRQAEKYGLAGQAHFVGNLDQREMISAYGSEGVIGVLPTLTEAVSKALLEQEAMEGSVVAYRVGGTPRTLEHGRTGYLVRKGDIAELAERIHELIADPEKRIRMGKAARKYVQDRRSLEALAGRHETFYLSALPFGARLANNSRLHRAKIFRRAVEAWARSQKLRPDEAIRPVVFILDEHGRVSEVQNLGNQSGWEALPMGAYEGTIHLRTGEVRLSDYHPGRNRLDEAGFKRIEEAKNHYNSRGRGWFLRRSPRTSARAAAGPERNAFVNGGSGRRGFRSYADFISWPVWRYRPREYRNPTFSGEADVDVILGTKYVSVPEEFARVRGEKMRSGGGRVLVTGGSTGSSAHRLKRTLDAYSADGLSTDLRRKLERLQKASAPAESDMIAFILESNNIPPPFDLEKEASNTVENFRNARARLISMVAENQIRHPKITFWIHPYHTLRSSLFILKVFRNEIEKEGWRINLASPPMPDLENLSDEQLIELGEFWLGLPDGTDGPEDVRSNRRSELEGIADYGLTGALLPFDFKTGQWDPAAARELREGPFLDLISSQVDPPLVSGRHAQPPRTSQAGQGSRLASGSTLESIFEGKGAIHSVFDVGTGQGEWLSKVRSMPWLNADAKIMGLEKEGSSDDYRNAHSAASIDWARRGLTVLETRSDPRYPPPGSLDLIHSAFLPEHDFDEYDRLLRPGGRFLFADSLSLAEPSRYVEWLDRKNYPYRIFVQRDGNLPPDYPKSHFFRHYESEDVRSPEKWQPRSPFLIVAQKTSRTANFKPSPWAKWKRLGALVRYGEGEEASAAGARFSLSAAEAENVSFLAKHLAVLAFSGDSASYARALIAAYSAGRIPKPGLKEPLRLMGEGDRFYMIKKGVEAGIYYDENEVSGLLESAHREGRWGLYLSILEDAMSAGVFTRAEQLRAPLEAFEQSGWWDFYARAVVSAVEHGVYAGEDIERPLAVLKDHEKETALVLEARIRPKTPPATAPKASVPIEKDDAEKTLVDFAQRAQWRPYSEFLEHLLAQGSLGKPLSEEQKSDAIFEAALEDAAGRLHKNADWKNRVRLSWRDALSKGRTIQARAQREDEKIDFWQMEQVLAPAFIQLSAVSENLAGQISDNYLRQRKYLPIFRNILINFASLSPAETDLLTRFYAGAGKALINQPAAVIDLVGYLEAYKELGLGFAAFESDLLQPGSPPQAIFDSMGRKILGQLARKLSVDVDIEQAIVSGRPILSEWDMKHVGYLASTQDSWKEEQRSLFKVLFKAALLGRAEGLLDPRAYEATSEDFLGAEYAELVRRVRRHNLAMLEAARQAGLNAAALLDPNQAVPPFQADGRIQRKPSVILEDFKSTLRAFEAWLAAGSNAELSTAWRKTASLLETVRGLKPSTPNVLRNIPQARLLEILEPFERRYAEAPAELSAFLSVLREVRSYDPAANGQEQLQRIRFWFRRPGHDLFLGNYAGSCLIGQDNSMFFEHLLDLGTIYAVVENEKGEPKSYARFFIAQTKSGVPFLNIDSIDGIAAKAGEKRDAVVRHVRRFASVLGIPDGQVVLFGYGPVDKKLGGTLTDDYMHHSGGAFGASRKYEGFEEYAAMGARLGAAAPSAFSSRRFEPTADHASAWQESAERILGEAFTAEFIKASVPPPDENEALRGLKMGIPDLIRVLPPLPKDAKLIVFKNESTGVFLKIQDADSRFLMAFRLIVPDQETEDFSQGETAMLNTGGWNRVRYEALLSPGGQSLPRFPAWLDQNLGPWLFERGFTKLDMLSHKKKIEPSAWGFESTPVQNLWRRDLPSPGTPARPAGARLAGGLAENFVTVGSQNNHSPLQGFFAHRAQQAANRLSDVFGNGRMNPDKNDAGVADWKKIQEIAVSREDDGLVPFGQPHDLSIFTAGFWMQDAMPERFKEDGGVPGDVLVEDEPQRAGLAGKGDEIALFELLGGEVKRRLNMSRGELRKILFRGDFFGRNAGFQELENLPDHNAGAREAGLPVADLGINGNQGIFPHKANYTSVAVGNQAGGRLAAAFAADPAANVAEFVPRILLSGWPAVNSGARLALSGSTGISVMGFAPREKGWDVAYFDAAGGRLVVKFVSARALEAARKESALSPAADTELKTRGETEENEIDRQIAEEDRQIRVFDRGTRGLLALPGRQMFKMLHGVIEIDLNKLDLQNTTGATEEFRANLPILVREIKRIRDDPLYRNVLFNFVGDAAHRRAAFARKVGLAPYQATKTQLARARRVVGWTGYPREPKEGEEKGYVYVSYAEAYRAHPMRPLLYYSLYLLALHNIPGDPHPATPADVDGRVIQEVRRLAGPSEYPLLPAHIFGFAQGTVSPELLSIGRSYTIRPFVQFLGARLAEYRQRLLALGSSA